MELFAFILYQRNVALFAKMFVITGMNPLFYSSLTDIKMKGY